MLITLNDPTSDSDPEACNQTTYFPLFQTKIRRRTFLKSSFAGLLTYSFGNVNAFPTRLFASKTSLDTLHLADFDTVLGERFLLLHAGELLGTVQLDVVKDRRQTHAKQSIASGECFSLSFRAPKQLAVLQDTYTFAHPRLGLFDLFVVPAAPLQDEQRYIAIINRI